MKKNLRRTCDNPKCGQLYRYKLETSKYCSGACRSVAKRQRKAEKDKAAREQKVTEIAARLRERQQIEAQIEPQPDSPARPAQRDPKPISRLFPPPAEPPAVVTIRNVPKRFPGTPLPRMLRKLDNIDFLLIDDLGYLSQGAEESEVLFTLIAERYERRSLGITSNLVFSEWDKVFANPMATAAAIDRVVHHSAILEFDVPSCRTGAAQQRLQQEVNRQK